MERAQGRHGKTLQDAVVLCHSQTRSPRRRSIVVVPGQDRNGCVGFYDFACVWFSKREISKTSVVASEVGQIGFD